MFHHLWKVFFAQFDWHENLFKVSLVSLTFQNSIEMWSGGYPVLVWKINVCAVANTESLWSSYLDNLLIIEFTEARAFC